MFLIYREKDFQIHIQSITFFELFFSHWNDECSHFSISVRDWFQDLPWAPTFANTYIPNLALPICGFHIPGFNQLSTTEDNSIYWKRKKKDTFKCTSTVQTHVVQGSTMCFYVHMCIYVCVFAYIRITYVNKGSPAKDSENVIGSTSMLWNLK